MARFAIFLGSLICFLALASFVLTDIAEARRLGGNKSFGSKPSYRSPAQKPAKPQQETPTATQQRQTPQQQQSAPARPGLGGMLGGLLMGGLIGSLLFGGLDAFSGLNIMDILIIGGILFLLFRLFRSRRLAMQTAGTPYQTRPEEAPAYVHQHFATSASGGQSAWDTRGATQAEARPEPNTIPNDFDVQDFLKGAKIAYARLQESWNARDMEDIQQFTTPEVFEEIQRQLHVSPPSGNTTILRVEAKLLEVRQEDGQSVASVLFESLLREDQHSEATQTREIWHFSRDGHPGTMWLLEGIQQAD